MDMCSTFGKILYFMDESSVHCWTTSNKAWMHPNDIFNVSIRKKGEWVTVYGALGGKMGAPIELIHSLKSTTNKENTVEFFKQVRSNHMFEEITILLDNHRAHYSHIVRDYCNSHNIKLIF